jgi:DNA-binding CsgD family transcriptional regulator
MSMKISRRSVEVRRLARPAACLFRDRYFFCEKSSGVTHFHVEAGPDGRFPADQAAGLLAMHCLVRGQSPRDYAVLVPAEERQLKDLYESTDKLLQVGKSAHRQIRLTRREEEVLNGLTRSLTNKEIAISLKLSERTVKFHVSSLLAKFNVRGRVELAREAWHHIPGALPILIPVASRIARPFTKNSSELQRAADRSLGSAGEAPDHGLSLNWS